MNRDISYKNALLISIISAVMGVCISRLIIVEPVYAKTKNVQSVVSANEFRLIDSEGKTRARLHFPSGGRRPSSIFDNPSFDIIDGTDRIRLSLGLESPMGRPFVKLNNVGGSEALYLGFDELGTDSPGLYVYKKHKINHNSKTSKRKRILLPIEVIWPNP